ncbi:PREDICTED: uncharacterized protein LOC105150494 isoform X2 [Acromyrmex echinatior]|uniref:uncharacterized protein LOC105150494 isoform X2 n=1 Tax=Acromyrmex echinatior TaxID=103372 RepID=UPI000580F8A8|nr:PREDICTED: uncharacterized protein LOC105150494 isoform X2 [Acromyrmex echinatior]
MSDNYRSVIDHLLESKNEAEMRSEKDKSEQDNDSQTSTPSCVSKMNYTLPKYRNNDAQKPQSQEMTELLSNDESEDPSNYEEKIYVSEVTFLLMASNRNQRMRDNVFQRIMPLRTNSRDSGFSELVEFVEETREKNHEDDRDWQ